MAKDKNIYKNRKSIFTKVQRIRTKAQKTITQKRMADNEFKKLFADSPKLEKEKMLLSSHYGLTFTHTRLFLPEKEREKIVKKIRKKYPSVKLIQTFNAYRLEDGASTPKEHQQPTGEALWVKTPTLKDRKRVITEDSGFTELS